MTDTLTEVRSLVQEVFHDLKNSVLLEPEQPAQAQQPRLETVIQHAFCHLHQLLPERNQEALLSLQSRLLHLMNAETAPGGSGKTQEVVGRFADELGRLAPEPRRKTWNNRCAAPNGRL